VSLSDPPSRPYSSSPATVQRNDDHYGITSNRDSTNRGKEFYKQGLVTKSGSSGDMQNGRVHTLVLSGLRVSLGFANANGLYSEET